MERAQPMDFMRASSAARKQLSKLFFSDEVMEETQFDDLDDLFKVLKAFSRDRFRRYFKRAKKTSSAKGGEKEPIIKFIHEQIPLLRYLLKNKAHK